MVNYYSKEAMLKGGLKMDCNNDLLDKSPNVKRLIAEYYLNNIRCIKKTMMEVLKRKLSDKEIQHLREHSYNLSIQQVANEFQDNKITLKNLLGAKGENNQITFPKENLINEIKKFI